MESFVFFLTIFIAILNKFTGAGNIQKCLFSTPLALTKLNTLFLLKFENELFPDLAKHSLIYEVLVL